ncbi:MAG: DUF4190 domain-containing protein, partial [Verrucomicrobiales bacterium]
MDQWAPLAQMPEWSNQMLPPPPGTGVQTGLGGLPVVPNNGMAIASMVCGIVSLLMFFSCFLGIVCAIPAVICGHAALKQIREYVLPMGGRGMAIAGLVTGYITLGLTLALVLVFVVTVMFATPEVFP